MAGDWTKWLKGFARKPEITAAASALGLSRQHIAAACMELFEWVDSEGVPDDEHDPDSDITIRVLSRSKRDESRALLSRLDEESRCAGLASALVEEGWIELHGECAVFKRAARHNTQTAKTRALASRRQKAKRAKEKGGECHAASVTREEKRRVYKTPTPFDAKSAELPAELDSDEFRAAWASWVDHRGEIRKKLTPTSVTKQLRELAQMGQRRAIAAIEWTVAKGWQGIREPEPPRGGKMLFDQPDTPEEAEEDGKYV